MRGLDQTLGDKPVEAGQPVIADRVAFEKRVVLRLRQLDQGAVRQLTRGAALRHRRDDQFAFRCPYQDRSTDPGKKL